ncbi:MAG: potassium transporter Trk, partial [Thermovirga sp.]|nr:potassium transporter Trk [Thermovirga sp.]
MLIVSGTLLLWILNHSYRPLSFIDSLFTATSAVCVTGLVVVNTATDLSFYSKCLIVVLMQLGGLGVMTAFTSLFILRGLRVSLQHRYCLSSSLGLDGVSGVIRLLGHIVKMTFAIELFGALLLFGELLDYYE